MLQLSCFDHPWQQEITVKIELAKNYPGWFQFYLCDVQDDVENESEECFNANPLKINEDAHRPFWGDDKEYKYWVPRVGELKKAFNIKVKLPTTMTCDHCTLRWIFWTGTTFRGIRANTG